MWWVILVVGFIALDQGSKIYISANMNLGESIPIVLGLFDITYWQNTGAAWGIFSNGRYFFIALTIIVTIIMIIVFIKNKSILLRYAIVFVLAGAWGNSIDRIYRGSVVDFLALHFFGFDFPIFNIADIYIDIGAILLAVFLIFIYKEEEEIVDIEKVSSEKEGKIVKNGETEIS